jgi:hypothetical protein
MTPAQIKARREHAAWRFQRSREIADRHSGRFFDRDLIAALRFGIEHPYPLPTALPVISDNTLTVTPDFAAAARRPVAQGVCA